MFTVESNAFSDLTCSVEVSLAKGQTYTAVFWAQDASSSAYTVSTEGENGDLTVTVNYVTTNTTTTDSALNNDETRDAFYAAVDVDVTGSKSVPVELKRPFAQINVGVTSDDWAAAVAAGITIEKSSVTISDVANVLNLMDGTVSQGDDFNGEITYALNTIPADQGTGASSAEESLTVNDVDYKWLSMSYILVDDETADGGGAQKATLSSLEYTFDPGTTGEDITLDLSSVPVQRNYRTNIIGKLLTGDIEFNIVIEPAYGDADDEEDTGDHNIVYWDGSISEPSYDETTSTYSITNASELAWLAAQVNGTSTTSSAKAAPLTKATYDTFSGKTFTLTNDIYLNNLPWTPIGNCTSYPTVTFAGTFEGNGYTIYGLNVTDQTANYASAGLFGSLKNGTIQNLTVKDATVTSSHYAGAIVGYANDGGTISNCTVDGAVITTSPEYVYKSSSWSWDNGDKAGGILGYTANKSDSSTSLLNISDCTVKNTTITGYRDLGGIAGFLGTYNTISGCTIDNVVINVNIKHNYNSLTSENYANYVGDYKSARSTGTVSDCSGTATINFDVAVVENDEELVDAVAEANAVVILTEGESYELPETVAAGVSIQGNGATLTTTSGQTLTGNGITISDVVLTCEGEVTTKGMLVVTGTGVVLDGLEVTSTQKGQYGIVAQSGSSVTITNSTFDQTASSRLVYGNSGSTVYLVDCEFSENVTYAYNSSGGTLNATGCSFHGWLSGWQEGGTFTDCTFEYGSAYYPCTVCYGTTTFSGCTFGKYGHPYVDASSNKTSNPISGTTYGYDCWVSCGASNTTITFTGCSYSNGDTFDTDVFIRLSGDGKKDPDTIIIDDKTYTGTDVITSTFRVDQ